MNEITALLGNSDLPRRLDDARNHSRYREAMTVVPAPPSAVFRVFVLAMLAGLTVFLWICVAVAPDPPIWLFLMMGSLSATVGWLMYATWRRFETLRHGEVRRELYAVLDRDQLALRNTTPRYYLTLWNPTSGPVRRELVNGPPECGVGDVGVALFRGDLLVHMIKVPVSSPSSA